MKIFLRLILFQFFIVTLSFADEYAVIANKKIEDLQVAQISAIFLKRLKTVNGIKLVPINLEALNPLRLDFEKKVLHMSLPTLKSYWIKQHYLGHRPPISMQSQQSVLSLVKQLDGGVAYINAKYIDEDVNVLYRWRDDD